MGVLDTSSIPPPPAVSMESIFCSHHTQPNLGPKARKALGWVGVPWAPHHPGRCPLNSLEVWTAQDHLRGRGEAVLLEKHGFFEAYSLPDTNARLTPLPSPGLPPPYTHRESQQKGQPVRGPGCGGEVEHPAQEAQPGSRGATAGPEEAHPSIPTQPGLQPGNRQTQAPPSLRTAPTLPGQLSHQCFLSATRASWP